MKWMRRGLLTKIDVILLVGVALFLFWNLDQSPAAGPPTTISGTPSGVGGLNTLVNANPTSVCSASCVITGGTRSGPNGTGANLFHSFAQFSVGAGDVATFLNNTGLPTTNILARVTGTTGNNPTLSSIYGTIQTSGFGAANLFLMNPAGFLFGANATVNVGGMMTFTTADYLKLADGGRFNANPNATPPDILTAAPVVAFGFLGTNPGAVNFEGGQLTVAGGTGLALVGGDIKVIPDASSAPSGITSHGRPVLLTSVAGPGEVAADTGLPAAGMALGTVTLGQGTTLSTVGDALFGDGSGGAISIRGGQLIATDAQILTTFATGTSGHGGDVTIVTTGSAAFMNSTIDTRTLDPKSALVKGGDAGPVNISALDLTLTNSSVLTGVNGDATAAMISTGAGGAVTLTGSDIVTLSRSLIDTRTRNSNGNGGAVTLDASTITLENSSIFTGVSGLLRTTANGGSVILGGPQTNNVSMTNSRIITESFETEGNGGSVTITGQTVNMSENQGAQTIVTSTHHDSSKGDFQTSGNGGDVHINGSNVTFNGADVESVADSPGTSSRGGNISVNGAQTILVDNGTVFITTTISEGHAGNIQFTSPQVTITGGSQIGSSTEGGGGSSGTITVTGTQNISLDLGSLITTNAGPDSLGSSGEIVLNTPHLTITGGSAVANQNFGSGPAGTVTFQGINGPAQSVLISDGSLIFTNTDVATGPGSNIFVNAHSFTLQNGSSMFAGTNGAGNGGNILVKADAVGITGGSQMSSGSVIGDSGAIPTGNAGNVTIQGLASPAQSILVDGTGSGVFTDTQGTGAGGNIFVNANTVTLSNGGTLSAKTSGTEPSATGGTITVNAGTFTLGTGSTVTAASSGAGAAGDITVQGINGRADSVLISGMDENFNPSGIFTDTSGTGAGGNITINASAVTVQNSGTLSATTESPGNGGNVQINASTINLLDFGSINTLTFLGDGSAGNITLKATQSIMAADSFLNTDAVQGSGQGGNILLSAPTIGLNGALLSTSTSGTGHAGNILLEGQQINLGAGQAGGSMLSATTIGSGHGGTITLRGLDGPLSHADNVTIAGGSQLQTLTGADGPAGNITISAGQFSLTDHSVINADTNGPGSAGAITIAAPDSATISGPLSRLSSSSTFGATGNAGRITVSTPNLVIENAGSISTSTNTSGSAGTITVSANNLQLLSGGNITSSSAVLDHESAPPTGAAGTVTIQGLAGPAESVLISGQGSGISTNTQGTGAGGNITVNVNAITLENGGSLSAATSGSTPSASGGTITVNANQVQLNSGGLITAATSGSGAGGSVNINAGSTFAINAGTVSSSAAQATGGDININAGGSVTLDNGSLITASSNGPGNAGNIFINAGQSYASTNSSVTTKAEHASGGNITVLATGMVHLTNSEINASVEGSQTTVGGNILIDPVYVILQNSQILARATQGTGGNINIFYTGALLADPSSVISASSQFGQSGTITIQSPNAPASGRIVPLGKSPLVSTSLLSQRCAALQGGNFSSFTVAGRDTLPSEPGSWLSSLLALGTLSDEKVLQAHNDVDSPLLSLRQIAPAGFLTHTYAIDSRSDCS